MFKETERLTFTDRVDAFAARLIVVCIFLPGQLQVFGAIAAGGWLVLRSVFSGRPVERKALLWAALLGGGYLLYWLAVPFSPERYRAYALTLCERRAAYLAMPLVFALLSAKYGGLVRRQLPYFVAGVIIVFVTANAAFIYHYAITGHVALTHVDYRILFEHATGIHPTYASLYLVFAIAILIADNVLPQLINSVVVLLLLCLLLPLFAKSPLIAMLLIAMHQLWAHRKELHRYRLMMIAVCGLTLISVVAVPFVRQRLMEVADIFNGQQHGLVIENSVDTRKLVWQTDLHMLSHHWFSGVGPGRVLPDLRERYFFASLQRGYWVGYFDPHSQYFWEWLSFGLVGILLLLIVLVVQFRRALKRNDKMYLYLMVAISITFFTETVLARQQGLLFYSIFTSLLFFSRVPVKKGVVQ